MAAFVVTSPADVVWTVRSEHPPRVLRHCPRCACERRFASSGRFRVNAQQRRLDVWLIYRCTACDATWNLPLLERVAPERLADGVLRRLERNEAELALAYATDLALLRRARVAVGFDGPWRVERPPLDGGVLRIRFVVAGGCTARLDRLLAAELGTSRARVATLAVEGTALRRPVRDGQVVTMDVRPLTAARPASMDGT